MEWGRPFVPGRSRFFQMAGMLPLNGRIGDRQVFTDSDQPEV